MPSELSKTVRLSRRHFFKAVGIVIGSLSASWRADAQSNDGGKGGWNNHPWGEGGPWDDRGRGDDGGRGDGDHDRDDRGHYCFLRGTLIRTGDRYRPIETLSAGEFLPTRFSGIARIREISSFTVRRDQAGHWPTECRLVRIKAGALSDTVPARDLFVTESHAILLNDVLIPIGSLVNDKTILFEDRPDMVALDYFHIEFDSHDVIDAEGALCESRRDPAVEPCAPLLPYGRRSQVLSRLRSAAAPVIDRRQPFDRIRDRLEIRAGL